MSRPSRRQPAKTTRRRMYGVGSIDNDTYMVTADGGGTPGVDTGFYFGLLNYPRRSENGTSWFSRRVLNTSGYILRQLSGTTITFSCANNVGTFVNSPAWTVVINQVTGILCVHDGSVLRLYVNRVEVGDGSGTAITGYTPSAVALGLGGAGGTTPQYDFYGAVSGHGVPDLAAVQGWFDACKGARACRAVPGLTPSNLWNARTTLAGPLDSAGSSNLSLGGSGHVLVAERSPVWGW